MPFSVVELAPSKKTNVLFLEKIAPSRVSHACFENSAQRKTNKMASEITFVGDGEIPFLSSVSLPNLRQALGENVLDSDAGYEDYTSDSDDGSENILEKSFGEDVSDMSDEDFPVRREKRFTVKKGVELRKNQLKANQAGKGKIHLENIFPLRTYRD